MKPSTTLDALNFSVVARATGFTRTHVSRVVQGLNHTSLEGAAKIAEAAHVTIDELWEHIEFKRAERQAPRPLNKSRGVPTVAVRSVNKPVPTPPTPRAGLAAPPPVPIPRGVPPPPPPPPKVVKRAKVVAKAKGKPAPKPKVAARKKEKKPTKKVQTKRAKTKSSPHRRK